jgi:bacillolysin
MRIPYRLPCALVAIASFLALGPGCASDGGEAEQLGVTSQSLRTEFHKSAFDKSAAYSAPHASAGTGVLRKRVRVELEAPALSTLRSAARPIAAQLVERGARMRVQHDGYVGSLDLQSARVSAADVPAAKLTDPKLRALAFLAPNRELFGLRAAAAKPGSLPALEVGHDLTVTRHRRDLQGFEHTRLQQTVAGVRVLGAEMSMHYASDGSLTAVASSYRPGLETLSTTPAVSLRQAASIGAEAFVARHPWARAAIEPQVTSLDTEAMELELLVLPEDLGSRETSNAHGVKLAYRMTLAADEALGQSEHVSDEIFVDAQTGEVISVRSALQAVQAVGSGKNARGVTRAINITGDGKGVYALIDSTHKGAKISTFSRSSGAVEDVLSDKKESGWDTDAPVAPGAAVDAHYFMGVVLDKMTESFGKAYGFRAAVVKGQDRLDEILLVTHVGVREGQALFDPKGRGFYFGDGPGGNLTELGMCSGFDVLAHEYIHGVTQLESGLLYQGDSGALNEAMSDIMASFLEYSYKPNDKTNWVIGEDVYTKGPVRSMVNPAAVEESQPRHKSEYAKMGLDRDQGGVHKNSGIINHAAYLMTKGGTNAVSKGAVPEGIGPDNAMRVWHLANTDYLKQDSTFTDAADATVRAAKELKLSENDQAIVACAWIAVGYLKGTCEATGEVPQSLSGGTGPVKFDESELYKPSEEPGCGVSGRPSAGNGLKPALYLVALAWLVAKRRARSRNKSDLSRKA